MQISNSSRAIVATATIALLAGCGGGSTSSSIPSSTGGASYSQSQVRGLQHPELASRPGIVAATVHGLPQIHGDAASFKGTVVVSDSGSNEVFYCKAKGGCKSVGSNWSEPQGLAVDSKGNVYVADTSNSQIVVLSKTGAPVKTLSDPGYFPAGVSVAHDGTVGVTNICSAPSCGEGNIVFYAPGSTSPTSTATGVNYRFYFGGFDKGGDFYSDGTDESGVIHVTVVKSGSTTNTDTGLGSGVAFPGGVIGTTKGTIIVDDQSCPCARTYSLPGLSLTETTDFSGASDPVTIGMNRKNNQISTADAGNAYAGLYAYPAGGSPTYTITGFSEPIGVGNIKTGTE